VLPIQVRAVFLIEQNTIERIYTYAFPDTQPAVVIGERLIDTVLPEVLRGVFDRHVDTMRAHFVRTWTPGSTSISLPDLASVPPNLRARLFSDAVEEDPSS
jgi:hypothetical protein